MSDDVLVDVRMFLFGDWEVAFLDAGEATTSALIDFAAVERTPLRGD